MINNGDILSSSEVFRELGDYDDEIAAWAKLNKNTFIKPTLEKQAEGQRILEKHPDLVKEEAIFLGKSGSRTNENCANIEWSRFWAEYIRAAVPRSMMIGEMPSSNRVDGGGECETLFNPMTLIKDRHYDYVDISQAVSGHEFSGDVQRQAIEGSRRILEFRRAMAESGTSRPLILSKDYTRGPEGRTIVFWSRFVGGAASARFHRPAADHPESLIVFQHE